MLKGGKVLSIAVLSLLLFLAACAQMEERDNLEETTKTNSSASEKQTALIGTKKEMIQPKKIEQEITLSAIGDILVHSTVYEDARTESGFDFKPMLTHVKPFLNDTTITFANQETMIGGEAFGLSTYPRFNSPFEVGDALKDVGVNVVSIANNHTLDRGEEVVQRAIKHWQSLDMMYTGAYQDEADRERLRIFESEEGISVAFLAYTYGTNGIPVPDGKNYLVNLIDQEIIAGEIARARKQADAVVLSLHFGNEYERMPSEAQKQLVQFAADQGADIVLGHHPHVLQPMDWVEGKDGKHTLVVYSLGNFLSGQDEFYRRIGGIAQMTIKKTIEADLETIEVMTPKFIPTFVKYDDRSHFEVIPMYQLTEEDLTDAAAHYEAIKAHMSQWMPELEFIED
ncbi:CapA family protein [Lentibacillus saliphilus]|uniref:CapA family protein n=1 Tax=Lentibacillus saliphilus TaxID=2737028 RepID=UPI001FE35832|nr:CapA family protein [Lentibacillus saliphilus]